MEKPQAQKWIKTSNPGQVTTEPTWHSFAIYRSSVKSCISTTRAYLVCCNSSLATSMYRMLLKLCTIKPFLLCPGSCRLSVLSACPGQHHRGGRLKIPRHHLRLNVQRLGYQLTNTYVTRHIIAPNSHLLLTKPCPDSSSRSPPTVIKTRCHLQLLPIAIR